MIDSKVSSDSALEVEGELAEDAQCAQQKQEGSQADRARKDIYCYYGPLR